MKKTLLIAVVLGMAATTAWADGNASKYDTTIEAQIGVNKYNQDTETPDSMLWKFTADKNYLAQVGPLAGSYDYVYVSTIVKNNDTQKNASAAPKLQPRAAQPSTASTARRWLEA